MRDLILPFNLCGKHFTTRGFYMGRKKIKLFYSLVATAAVFILPLLAVQVLMKKPVSEKVYRISREYVAERCGSLNIEFPEYDPAFVTVDDEGKVYTVSAYVYVIENDKPKKRLGYNCKLINQSGNSWLLSDLGM